MIGERLAKLRKEKGLKQYELAEYLSVSKYSITMYETNKNTPPEKTLIDIAKYFDTSTDYLLGLTDLSHSYKKDTLQANPKETINNEKDYIIQVSEDVPASLVENFLDYIEFINQKYKSQ